MKITMMLASIGLVGLLGASGAEARLDPPSEIEVIAQRVGVYQEYRLGCLNKEDVLGMANLSSTWYLHHDPETGEYKPGWNVSPQQSVPLPATPVWKNKWGMTREDILDCLKSMYQDRFCEEYRGMSDIEYNRMVIMELKRLYEIDEPKAMPAAPVPAKPEPKHVYPRLFLEPEVDEYSHPGMSGELMPTPVEPQGTLPVNHSYSGYGFDPMKEAAVPGSKWDLRLDGTVTN